MTDACRDEEVGSLGEETAKLLGVFSTWAREHASGPGGGMSRIASSSVHSLVEAAAALLVTARGAADGREDVDRIDLGDDWSEGA